MALECATTTGSKGPNIEAKDPQVLAGVEQPAIGNLKPTVATDGALNRTTDRSAIYAVESVCQGPKGDGTIHNSTEKYWTMVSSKKGTPNKKKVQQVEQRQKAINSSVAEVLKGEHVPSSSTPTIHFSSPQVEKIIKESQIEMMLNANLMFKQPLVTLNTSVYGIPSQSCESFSEHGGESGQPILSTGNNKEIIQAKVRDMASNLWADQREEDDEENWGDEFAGNLTEDGDQDSEDEGVLSVGSPSLQKSGNSTILSSNSKLNAKAPVFVPKAGQQHFGTSTTGATRMKNAVPSRSGQQQIIRSTPAATLVEDQYAVTPSAFGQQQQIANSLHVVTSNAEQQQHDLASAMSIAGQQQKNASTSTGLILPSNDAKQQQDLNATLITLEDRKLLNVIVSSKPVNSLNHSAFSTGRLAKDMNKIQGIEP
nr:uncharacterized protein LOC108945507 isoform X2 [Nicotiana tomentosiformis]